MTIAFDVEGTLIYIGGHHKISTLQTLVQLGVISSVDEYVPNNKGLSLEQGLLKFQNYFAITDEAFTTFSKNFLITKATLLHTYIQNSLDSGDCIINKIALGLYKSQELRILITNEAFETITLLDNLFELSPHIIICSDQLKVDTKVYPIKFGKPSKVSPSVSRLMQEFGVTHYCGDTHVDEFFAISQKLDFIHVNSL